MESSSSQIEPVTLSEVLELATWDRQRSDSEIENFISRREAAVARQVF
jgi:hypothetical protein